MTVTVLRRSETQGETLSTVGYPCQVHLVHIVCQVLLSPLHAMIPVAPPYASQFVDIAMHFLPENILHVEPKRSVLSPDRHVVLTAKIEPLPRIFPH